MSIEVGSKLQGKVTGITNFGAFVELPEGQTGLVHISEVADKYVEDIREVLEVGNEVTVKVLQVGDDGKIGLSIRKAVDRPKTATRSPRSPKTKRPRKDLSFEDKMNKFLKDSEERLFTLKKQTESKRGGRGARRG